ncbi:TetR/AcrR family transcriptional regulator [Paraburkholderia phymatum]|uniref:Transcriptional regulator, TetR family n=1 Tax=Paraburkholderia phymatum (strain DSM 17167 / CIP 108236 / LMG 21445 / STM815) TaxID=391038 RepID=B2JFF4_PARP8|nr:TetR/AcrR family transcriptional regulator [Paraburkholderia phymatum]ACC71522.1 transcriptional regulator, TetR family [Paraburkholderia phymatum STM815]
MKVSKEKAAQNRAALVQTAARLFRERGIDGVGVAEIGKAAGLTHGALYAHFPSKEALAAEALTHGLEISHSRMVTAHDGRLPSLSELLDSYLSEEKRDDIANGCALAASASEIGRQDEAISARYSDGFEKMAAVFEKHLHTHKAKGDHREKALAISAALIGAISASRAVLKAQPQLANEILHAVRRTVGEIAGE